MYYTYYIILFITLYYVLTDPCAPRGDRDSGPAWPVPDPVWHAPQTQRPKRSTIEAEEFSPLGDGCLLAMWFEMDCDGVRDGIDCTSSHHSSCTSNRQHEG